MLSLNGIKVVEVEEDELGIPVTASYHIKIPPRHNAVFEVNIHVETEGTQVIMRNKHLLEKHPNMYQHEIAMMSEVRLYVEWRVRKKLLTQNELKPGLLSLALVKVIQK